MLLLSHDTASGEEQCGNRSLESERVAVGGGDGVVFVVLEGCLCPLLLLRLSLRSSAAPGGSFLLEDRAPAEVFTPEDLSAEQRQIAQTAARFAREKIDPAMRQIEAKEDGVMRGLLTEAAELGFTAVDVPEEYGGLGLDKVTSALVADF